MFAQCCTPCDIGDLSGDRAQLGLVWLGGAKCGKQESQFSRLRVAWGERQQTTGRLIDVAAFALGPGC